jgi:hypothetical protein
MENKTNQENKQNIVGVEKESIPLVPTKSKGSLGSNLVEGIGKKMMEVIKNPTMKRGFKKPSFRDKPEEPIVDPEIDEVTLAAMEAANDREDREISEMEDLFGNQFDCAKDALRCEREFLGLPEEEEEVLLPAEITGPLPEIVVTPSDDEGHSTGDESNEVEEEPKFDVPSLNSSHDTTSAQQLMATLNPSIDPPDEIDNCSHITSEPQREENQYSTFGTELVVRKKPGTDQVEVGFMENGEFDAIKAEHLQDIGIKIPIYSIHHNIRLGVKPSMAEILGIHELPGTLKQIEAILPETNPDSPVIEMSEEITHGLMSEADPIVVDVKDKQLRPSTGIVEKKEGLHSGIFISEDLSDKLTENLKVVKVGLRGHVIDPTKLHGRFTIEGGFLTGRVGANATVQSVLCTAVGVLGQLPADVKSEIQYEIARYCAEADDIYRDITQAMSIPETRRKYNHEFHQIFNDLVKEIDPRFTPTEATLIKFSDVVKDIKENGEKSLITWFFDFAEGVENWFNDQYNIRQERRRDRLERENKKRSTGSDQEQELTSHSSERMREMIIKPTPDTVKVSPKIIPLTTVPGVPDRLSRNHRGKIQVEKADVPDVPVKLEIVSERETPTTTDRVLGPILGTNPRVTSAGKIKMGKAARATLFKEMQRLVNHLEEVGCAPTNIVKGRLINGLKLNNLDYSDGVTRFIKLPRRPQNNLMQHIRIYWLQRELYNINCQLQTIGVRPWILLGNYKNFLEATEKYLAEFFIDPRFMEQVIMVCGSSYNWREEFNVYLTPLGQRAKGESHTLQFIEDMYAAEDAYQQSVAGIATQQNASPLIVPVEQTPLAP